jgi:outer membrane protein assembly factor BamB
MSPLPEPLPVDPAQTGVVLEDQLRTALEEALHYDLSDVRVHTGPTADNLTANLGADAVTIGAHIYFRDGLYRPMTPSGRRLIAHEAAHVAQQGRAAPASARSLLDTPGDAWERQADSFADAFAASGRVRPLEALAVPPMVQRHISFEHRWLGDGESGDLVTVAMGKNTSMRNEILDNQIKLMMLWHDKPGEVDESKVKALCPWIRTLRLGPEQVLLTYGELNALPDYFANPQVIENLPKGVLLPVLQVIRQESYNMLQRLRTGKNPDWAFPESAAPPWGSSHLSGIGLNTINDIIDSVGETNDLGKFSLNFGRNGSDHYGGLLARNACHFAPYSWRRWTASTIVARSLATAAHDPANSDRREQLERQAWLYQGYADHFLQDSFAAGHLLNKTMVMQWWIEWAENTEIYIENWELIKDLTVEKQPGLANLALYNDFEGPSNDPQTVEEYLTLAERMKHTGMRPYRDYEGLQIEGLTAYQRYLALLGSSVAQVATNALHDVYNGQSVWVSSAAKPDGYEVWGDATLFSTIDGNADLNRGDGVQATSEATQLSQRAIRELLETGNTSIDIDSIRSHFPTKAGNTKGAITSLSEWNQQQRDFCVNDLFNRSLLRLKDIALTGLSPRLSPVSQDEDGLSWYTSLDKTGYRDTFVLTHEGRLFAASYGFIYELRPGTGEVINSAVVGLRGSDADYTMTLATDGVNLFAGTHGYVYSISLTTWKENWNVYVSGHSYYHVNVAFLGGELIAGSNGHVYRLDRTTGDIKNNLDLGGEDQTFSYDGSLGLVFAGREGRLAAIQYPDARNRDRFDVLWQQDYEHVAHPSTPVTTVVVNGRLFAAVNDLQELDPRTGKLIRGYGGYGYQSGSGDIRLATDGTRVYSGATDLVNAFIDAGKPGWQRKVGSMATQKDINPNQFPVSILCLKGRVFAGSNGYLYELDPDNGAVVSWVRPTYALGLGDYNTRMTTDGRDIFLGMNGYVYKYRLADLTLEEANKQDTRAA